MQSRCALSQGCHELSGDGCVAIRVSGNQLGVVIVMRGVDTATLLSFISSVSRADRTSLEMGRSSGSDSREASGGFAERRRSVDGPGREVPREGFVLNFEVQRRGECGKRGDDGARSGPVVHGEVEARKDDEPVKETARDKFGAGTTLPRASEWRSLR